MLVNTGSEYPQLTIKMIANGGCKYDAVMRTTMINDGSLHDQRLVTDK